MKMPNGYGSVYKLSGKRRKQWGARKTIGWEVTDTGEVKQKYAIIGYFETRPLAIKALANYNENPYDLKADTITFREVYEKWSEEHFNKIVPSAVRTWKSAFKYCSDLADMRMKDVKTIHLEKAIETAKVGDATKGRMKSLFNLMYRYAMKHEIVDKDYAALCNKMKPIKSTKEKKPFTPEEIQLLWDNTHFPCVDMLLIAIYSGWRPQELSILKIADIDLENKVMKGGLKTDAGKNRYVPIHDKILPLIKQRYNASNEFLFTEEEAGPMTYDKYRTRFKKVILKLKLSHTPHETRHTFITLGKYFNMDEYCLKLIVGHSIQDITEKVYTHRTLEELKEEINKITI